MGVLSCGRKGCESIMCDNYSHEHGYLCWECMEELIDSGGKLTIEEFMRSEKQYKPYSDSWESYVREVFKND